jgi:hypothetical protein
MKCSVKILHIAPYVCNDAILIKLSQFWTFYCPLFYLNRFGDRNELCLLGPTKESSLQNVVF